MMNLAEYRRSDHAPCRLPALGRTGRRRHRPQQGRIVPAHRALSRSRSRFRRSGRARRGRRPAQQCLAPPRLRLGDLRRGAAVSSRTPIRRAVSGCRLGAGRCRAPGAIRGGGRAFRVQPISSPSSICRRPRTRRAPSAGSMRDASAGRLPTPTKRCAASSTGPTACCNWSKGSCRSAAGSMTARR